MIFRTRRFAGRHGVSSRPRLGCHRYVREVIHDALACRRVQAKTIGLHLYALTLLPTGAAHASAVLLSVGRMTEGPVQSAVEAAVKEWRGN